MKSEYQLLGYYTERKCDTRKDKDYKMSKGVVFSMENVNKRDISLSKRGYELVNFCEFDKYAAQSYCAIHEVDPKLNLGDITKVDETKLKPFNMICGGSPCFVEGTLVLTDNGYIPIEQVKVGDKVLSHTNKYNAVSKTMINETKSLVRIGQSPSESIYCTPEHPFYTRRKYLKWDNDRRSYTREFEKPTWKKARELTKDDYIGTAINQESELPNWNGYDYPVNQYNKIIHRNELSDMMLIDDFWYIVGRYIGDGWLKKYDEKTIIICGNENEISQITDKLDNLNINYCIVKDKTVCKIQFVKKEIFLYLNQFGSGAANKHLTKDIINLPITKLQAFLNGYIDADGSFTQGKYKISSVSRRLIYEIGECVAKAFHRPFSIYFTSRPKTSVIEGRVVNQKDSYSVVWKMENTEHDCAFYEDGYVWSKINSISEENADELVYNLEVENDNSYMVQNIIVHNCQDFSLAGKQKGSVWKCNDCGEEYNPLTVHYSERHKCPKCGSENLDKSRSSLLVEWLRVIRFNKPSWGTYENVKNIVGSKFKETFQMFIDELNEYGYNTHYKVLNAKDYGIPQNRERVYLIIIKKELDNGKFKFPEPFDNGLRLRDMLEDEVDEKYYINTQKANDLIADLKQSGKLDKEVSNAVRGGGRGSVDRHQWDLVEGK